MTLYFPDSSVTITEENRDSNNDLANADSVTFEYRMNEDDISTAIPTNPTTGNYSVTLTPGKNGALRYEWNFTTSGVVTVKRGLIKISATGLETGQVFGR